MEGTLDRECARLSRGPRGTGLGGLRATAWEPRNNGPGLRERRRRQGCQRRTDSTRARGKKTPSRTIDRAPKWEARREARFSPVSSASGGPEPPGACCARLRTGEAAREEDVRADEHGAARLRDESDPRTLPQGIARDSVAALGSGGARVLELERFRSAEVDRTHRRSRRPWALPSAPRTRAT